MVTNEPELEIKPPDKPKPKPGTHRVRHVNGPTGGPLYLCPCGVILHPQGAHNHIADCDYTPKPTPLNPT